MFVEEDPCLSNPCVLGTCKKTGPLTYNCLCWDGYTGPLCDEGKTDRKSLSYS